MKKFFKFISIVISTLLTISLLFLVIVYSTEYKPDAIEKNPISYAVNSEKELKLNESISLLTFNIGYCGLDANEDFFMDGGKNIMKDSKEGVLENLKGIKEILDKENSDITFIQEVDRNSKKTYFVDQVPYLVNDDETSAYATFYRSLYVPYPFKQTLGKVESGMLVKSKFVFEDSYRIDLPSAYSFPVRAFQCKRALMRQELDINGTDKKLVLYNLHLEAYDKNNTREKQLEILTNMMKQDFKEGNYVIAGGDFNQRFPNVDNTKYPILNDEYFQAPIIDENLISNDFKFVNDISTPSARLLNKPYDGNREKTQLYLIDGYIVSSNVKVESVKTLDYDFKYSDHNPVKMVFSLK